MKKRRGKEEKRLHLPFIIIKRCSCRHPTRCESLRASCESLSKVGRGFSSAKREKAVAAGVGSRSALSCNWKGISDPKACVPREVPK